MNKIFLITGLALMLSLFPYEKSLAAPAILVEEPEPEPLSPKNGPKNDKTRDSDDPGANESESSISEESKASEDSKDSKTPKEPKEPKEPEGPEKPKESKESKGPKESESESSGESGESGENGPSEAESEGESESVNIADPKPVTREPGSSQSEEPQTSGSEGLENMEQPSEEEERPLLDYVLMGCIGFCILVFVILVIALIIRKNKKKSANNAMSYPDIPPATGGSKATTVNPGNIQSQPVYEPVDIELEVVNGTLMNKGYTFVLRDRLTIGRGRQCDIVFGEPDVSEIHAALVNKGDTIYIENVSKDQGTYIEQMRIAGINPVTSGDLISIGSVEFRLHIISL